MAEKKTDAEKSLWVGWTRDALSRYVIPDDVKDEDDLIDDMVDVAAGYADAMLEEYDYRFSGGDRRRRGRKKKIVVEEDDDDDDDDDDDN